MILIMSTIMNMEFVHALNPLYAFPIVAVILCAFIVYAFGFKSPVQPPSFDSIDEEKKSIKKRKTKESSKVKVVQNGNNLNKSQVSISNKKKESDKSFPAEKAAIEKLSNEKKMTKKSKSSEKKVPQGKKKDSFSQEDASEGGWVQLISKKGRKNRKKDEATNVERQTSILKPVQNLQNNKSDEIILSEKITKADVIENSVPEEQLTLKNEGNETIPSLENPDEKNIIIEDCKTVELNIQKIAFEENVLNNEKTSDDVSTKSKKKKKKNTETNTNSNDESTIQQVISEISAPLHSTNSSFTQPIETSDILIGKTEVNNSKENRTSNVVFDELAGKTEVNNSKENRTSNVVFDELAGLYPEPKEQKKKKKVRRDH